MFLLMSVRSRFPLAAVLATASALLLGGTASAQASRPVYIPPDVKGFQAQQIRQQAAQQQTLPGPRVSRSFGTVPVVSAAAPPVQVTLTFPNVPATAFVAIRGPDGELRYFPVEGGREGLQTRVIVVHPGERVHVQLPPANPH